MFFDSPLWKCGRQPRFGHSVFSKYCGQRKKDTADYRLPHDPVLDQSGAGGGIGDQGVTGSPRRGDVYFQNSVF